MRKHRRHSSLIIHLTFFGFELGLGYLGKLEWSDERSAKNAEPSAEHVVTETDISGEMKFFRYAPVNAPNTNCTF